MTFHELFDCYFHQHLGRRASRTFYERLYVQYFSTWGNEHPAKNMIRSWHRSCAETPAHANKGLGFLKALYNWAITEGLFHGDNPASGIRRHYTFARDVVMTEQQMVTVLHAMPTMHWKFRHVLLMLLCTGCRLSEALKAQWEDVDLIRQVWTKPTTKTGRPQRVPLPLQLCIALTMIPRSGPYVFKGAYDRHLSRAAVEKSWSLVRAPLGLSVIRLHDMRRTVATRLYEQGEPEILIKSILNHHAEHSNITAIYVRPSLDRQAKALQKHADSLWQIIDHAAQKPDQPTRQLKSWSQTTATLERSL